VKALHADLWMVPEVV